MNIENFIKKRNRNINPSISSLKLVKNKKFLNFNNNINKEYFKIQQSTNILPQIKNSNSLNIKKRFFNKKIISNINQNTKNIDKMNFISLSNNSIFKLNNNIISIKKPSLLTNKIKPLLQYRNFQNSQFENSSLCVNGKKNIQYQFNNTRNKEKIEKFRRANSFVNKDNSKEFVKTVNVYFKSNFKNSESVDDINMPKVESHMPKTKSMFMTGMNFLMNNNGLNKDVNVENKEVKKNFNYMSFKELLKHIEENKKKIIDNQNDIEDMLKTAKDAHFEIWKCNHHNKKI